MEQLHNLMQFQLQQSKKGIAIEINIMSFKT